MTVTVEDILKIKAGAVKTFPCDNLRQCKAGQSQVFYVGKFCRDKMSQDIDHYKTSIDGQTLIVQAIKKLQ